MPGPTTFSSSASWANKILNTARQRLKHHKHDDRPYVFVGCCLDLDGEFIRQLSDEPQHATLQELKENCRGLEHVLYALGYDDEYPIERDKLVGFWKAEVNGKSYLYLDHSRIEWVWQCE